jgi:Spy/CpxP family protein refolding chaperone
MIRKIGFALMAAVLLTSPAVFAGDKADDKACCAQGVANKEGQKPCADLTSLNLNDDQKTKIEAWQADCMKDGCTKESRHKFMQQAKGILSAEQFAKLKAQCKRPGGSKDKDKTET